MSTKKKFKNYEVSHLLSLMYNNAIKDTAIFDLPKEKLARFIIDEFNKGHLRNCYLENLNYYRG